MALVKHRFPAAFTLIELMISIALIVVLMLGINQVFKMSSDAVGTGTRNSEMTRDSRAAAGTLLEDARNCVKDSPLFFIRNVRVTPDPGKPSESFRHDYMGFFSRGLYRRESGSVGAFVGLASSTEAFQWIGYCDGAPTRKDTLGHMTILLRPNVAAGEPFLNSLAMPPGPPPGWPGTDVAIGSLDGFRASLANAFSNTNRAVDGTNSNWWWQPFVYPIPAYTTGNNPAQRLTHAAPIFVENVSQVIIEYTGDFVTQDPTTGAVTAGRPDGVPDFVVVKRRDPQTGKLFDAPQTLWYGMDRDVDGDGVVRIDVAPSGLPTQDVVPLTKIGQMYGIKWTWGVNGNPVPMNGAPFEREISNGPNLGIYTCVWANPKEGPAATGPRATGDPVNNGIPTMLRVLIKIEDPSGRIQEGQWHEFILRLQ